MNILFTINAKYLGLTKNCIKSIIRFDKDIDFYILHHDLSDDDQLDLIKTFNNYHFYFIKVDEKAFSDFPISKRYPLEIYYRLFSSLLLPQKLDRILYLDVDIVVINSLKDLYYTSFDDNAYIACSHIKKNMQYLNAKRLGIDKEIPYINTGVLLMNLKVLRNIVNKEAILNYVNKNKNKLILFDQDVLTALYGKKTKIVDYLKYNLSDRMMNIYNLRHPENKIDLDWVSKNSVIIHYCGHNKPWKKNYLGQLGYFYKQIM